MWTQTTVLLYNLSNIFLLVSGAGVTDGRSITGREEG